MDKAQAAQTRTAEAGAGQFRDIDGAGVAHDDKLRASLSVYEQGDLPAGAGGKCGQFVCLFVRVAPLCRVATGIQALQCLELTGLKPLRVAENGSYGVLLVWFACGNRLRGIRAANGLVILFRSGAV